MVEMTDQEQLYKTFVFQNRMGFEIVSGLYEGTIAMLDFHSKEVEVEYVKIPDFLNKNLEDEDFCATIDFIINEIIHYAIDHYTSEPSPE